jgi:maltooligosyltrehalose synthase
MADTKFLQAGGNSTCSITSMRKGQATESNTLEISTLNSRQAWRLAEGVWRMLARSENYRGSYNL